MKLNFALLNIMVIIVMIISETTTQLISRFNTLSISILDEVKNEYINVS